MQIELKLDRGGLYWAGLGVALHIQPEGRVAGEPWAWWAKEMPGNRSFRLGPLSGSLGRA